MDETTIYILITLDHWLSTIKVITIRTFYVTEFFPQSNSFVFTQGKIILLFLFSNFSYHSLLYYSIFRYNRSFNRTTFQRLQHQRRRIKNKKSALLNRRIIEWIVFRNSIGDFPWFLVNEFGKLTRSSKSRGNNHKIEARPVSHSNRSLDEILRRIEWADLKVDAGEKSAKHVDHLLPLLFQSHLSPSSSSQHFAISLSSLLLVDVARNFVQKLAFIEIEFEYHSSVSWTQRIIPYIVT